jgi:hypothetical protein
MRPLSKSHIETIGAVPVMVVETDRGVEKAWFYYSSQGAGAAYGILGAIAAGIADGIINYGPNQRAERVADEIAEEITLGALNDSLAEEFRKLVPTREAAVSGVRFGGVERRTIVGESDRAPVLDVLRVSVRYTMSEDASTLRVIADASYESPRTPYKTPYSFKTMPKGEMSGPAYRNTFTYYSSELPIPVLSPELKDRLVASIEDSARGADGAPPAEGTKEASALKRDIEKARDEELSKDEIAIFLAREWAREGGVALRREIEQAHAFIARYVLLDINRTTVPRMDGQDELIETLADDRTVRRVGTGPATGAYISSASNAGNFSTYGNTSAISEIHADRVDSLQQERR